MGAAVLARRGCRSHVGGGVTIRDDARMKRGIVVALAVACVCLSGCGGGTRHKSFPVEPEYLAPPSEAQRLAQACDEAGRELLKIDQHEVPSLPRGKLVEKDAEESQRLDWETAEEIRLLFPHSALTQRALADLARSQAEIRAIVRKLRRPGTMPAGLAMQFVRANGGCGRVQIRKPIAG